MSRYFVLAYKRSAGKLVEFHELSAYDDAFVKRSELDLRYRTDGDIEVSVLGADSIEELRKTHSRYFKSLPEMIKG